MMSAPESQWQVFLSSLYICNSKEQGQLTEVDMFFSWRFATRGLCRQRWRDQRLGGGSNRSCSWQKPSAKAIKMRFGCLGDSWRTCSLHPILSKMVETLCKRILSTIILSRFSNPDRYTFTPRIATFARHCWEHFRSLPCKGCKMWIGVRRHQGHQNTVRVIITQAWSLLELAKDW